MVCGSRFLMVMLSTGILLNAPAFGGTSIEGKPRVSFHAEGSPGFLTFEGVTRDITLKEDGENLVFTVPMDTVETGISLRDDHMRRNYVQTDKFPDVVLTVPRAGIQWPSEGTQQGTLTATFEAHGKPLEVAVAYDIKKTKSGYRVKAEFPFNTEKHGMEIPVYLGVTIKPDMRAEVTLDLTDA